MVLRVTAQLCRENCTYIAGETVRCKVLLENVAENGVSDYVTVAWCSAQIICRCSVNDTLIKLPKNSARRLEPEGNTTFFPSDSEKGQTVLAIPPSILCCDLQLPSGNRHELFYSGPLPFDAPASYTGRAVRYFYKLVIGVQLPRVSTKLLRVVLRVLVVPGLNEVNVERYEQAMDCTVVKQGEGAPSNPFLRNVAEIEAEERKSYLPMSESMHAGRNNSGGTAGLARRVGSEPDFGRLGAARGIEPSRLEFDSNPETKAKHTCDAVHDSNGDAKTSRLFSADLRSEMVLACASHLLGELASATSLHQFTVATRGGRVCRFYLHKAAFRLGETVVGAFDFAGCDVRTHRVVVHLESEERVEARFIAARAAQTSGSHVTCHASTSQTVACLRTATFELQVPTEAPAELCNELVSVRWRIRFEFHVLSASSSVPDGQFVAMPTLASMGEEAERVYTKQWKAPNCVETQATEWTLPIRVFPCSPLLNSAKTMVKPVVQLSIVASRPDGAVDVV